MRIHIVFCTIVLLFSGTYIEAYSQNCISCVSQSSLNSGLIFCLPFDGEPSDKASAKFNGILMNNPSSTQDRFGKAGSAYQFNGTNQFIRYGDILDSVFTKNPLMFSVSGWVKGSPPVYPYRSVIIGKSAGGTGPYQWYVLWDNDGKLLGTLCSTVMGPTDYIEQKSIAVVPSNSWTHFVYTFDGSKPQNQRNNFYVNMVPGVGLPMVGNLGTTMQNTTQELTVGAGHAPNNPFVSNNNLKGVVDDIRIYNRVLSSSEIQALFQTQNAIIYYGQTDTSICFGDSIVLNASGGERYEWRDELGLIDTLSHFVKLRPTKQSKYFVKIKQGSCQVEDTISVSFKNTPAYAGADKNICLGDSVNIGTGGNWLPSWTPTVGLSNPYTKIPIAKPNTTTIFVLQAIENGCKSYDTVIVNLVKSIVAKAGPDTSICGADSITLYGEGGTNFLWQPSSLMKDSTGSITKAYIPFSVNVILKTTSASCVGYDTLHVAVKDKPIVDIGNDTILCGSQAVTFNPLANKANQFRWTPNDLFLNNRVLNATMLPVRSTVVSLIAIDTISGCTTEDSILVKRSFLKAAFNVSPTLGESPLVVSFINQSSNHNSCTWLSDGFSFNTTMDLTFNHTYFQQDTILAKLIVKDTLGCSDSVEKVIYIYAPLNLKIPNVFTPNDDGINDYFNIEANMALVSKIRGQIFNRWGNLVYCFDSADNINWDGTTNGSLCANGVYFYSIIVEKINGAIKNYHGTLEILY